MEANGKSEKESRRMERMPQMPENRMRYPHHDALFSKLLYMSFFFMAQSGAVMFLHYFEIVPAKVTISFTLLGFHYFMRKFERANPPGNVFIDRWILCLHNFSFFIFTTNPVDIVFNFIGLVMNYGYYSHVDDRVLQVIQWMVVAQPIFQLITDAAIYMGPANLAYVAGQFTLGILYFSMWEIARTNPPDNVSIGWWILPLLHLSFLFTAKAVTDVCYPKKDPVNLLLNLMGLMMDFTLFFWYCSAGADRVRQEKPRMMVLLRSYLWVALGYSAAALMAR